MRLYVPADLRQYTPRVERRFGDDRQPDRRALVHVLGGHLGHRAPELLLQHQHQRAKDRPLVLERRAARKPEVVPSESDEHYARGISRMSYASRLSPSFKSL